MTPTLRQRIEEAAEKWLKDNDWDYNKYGDRRQDRAAYDTRMNYEISGLIESVYEHGALFGLSLAIEILRTKSYSETPDAERDHMDGAWMRSCANWLQEKLEEE